MATQTLPGDVRPAKIEHALGRLRAATERALAPKSPSNDAVPAAPSSMTKSIAHVVDMARLHLRGGNPGANARALAGEHRAADMRQQHAIEAVIASDGQERLFIRHPANGCLLATEN